MAKFSLRKVIADNTANQFVSKQIDNCICREEAIFNTAIVYPDILRVNIFRIILEFVIAIIFIMVKGTHQFSIGHIQMKLQLAEEVEKFEPKLFEEKNNSDKLSQIKRTLRLMNINYEILYLMGFVKLCKSIYAENEYIYDNEELLKKFVVAYTCGYENVEEKLYRHLNENNFPYGINSSKSYDNYSKIATNWWNSHRKCDN